MRKLGEVISLEYGKPLPKDQRCEQGGFPAYGANGIKTYSIESYCNQPSIIVGRKGTAGAVNLVEGGFWPLDVTYYVTFDGNEYDLKFLYYLLSSLDLPSLATGVKPGINRNVVYAIERSFPPLPEQKSIVAILDEAFAGIDAAIANTEKNLVNARELFESYLRSAFNTERDGWFNTTIGDQITLQRGFDITKKEQIPGPVPVVSSGGIKSYHDIAKVGGPGVVIGRKGSLGTVYFLEDSFWPHDTTLWVKDFRTNHPRFVYYFLRSLDLKKLDSGAANPALNRNMVHPIPIRWPAREKQVQLVEKFDAVCDESQRLEAIYQNKLSSLTELKQSLLKAAFSGELTRQSTENKMDEAAA